jgi:hypothetical protein
MREEMISRLGRQMECQNRIEDKRTGSQAEHE